MVRFMRNPVQHSGSRPGGGIRALPILAAVIIMIIASASGAPTVKLAKLSVPSFERKSLLNGMEVLMLPPGPSRRSFRLMIENGAAFDPVEKWGITHLTTRMLLEETEIRSGDLIRRQLDSLDAELEFQVGWDAIYLYGNAPEGNLAAVLGLLGEIVVRPLFREETFERLRAQQLEEVENQSKRPEVVTQKAFLANLFGPNPYGHGVLGTAETLQNLELRDVKIQYRKLFLPNQARLALHTSAEPQDLFRELSRRWGVWIRAEAAPFTFRRAPSGQGWRILLQDLPGDEALFRWGRLGVEMGSRDYYALKMLEEYLTLSLPGLARVVEAEQQIQASSRVKAFRMPGYLQLSLRTSSDRLMPYLKEFLQTMSGLRKGEVDSSLMEEARSLAYLEFRNRLEDPVGRLTRILDTSLYDLGVTYIVNYGLRLRRVTPEDFRKLLMEYLSQDSSLLVVGGPAAELKPELEALGPVQISTVR